MRINRPASKHEITAIVSTHPPIRFHAGSVNRKKFSGLEKIGSITVPAAAGANQKRASVGHSDAMAPPVMRAIKSEPPTARMFRKGLTGRFTSRPPKAMVRSSGNSSRCARLRREKTPRRTQKVTAAKAAKIPHCSANCRTNTPPYPSDRNQSNSTQYESMVRLPRKTTAMIARRTRNLRLRRRGGSARFGQSIDSCIFFLHLAHVRLPYYQEFVATRETHSAEPPFITRFIGRVFYTLIFLNWLCSERRLADLALHGGWAHMA